MSKDEWKEAGTGLGHAWRDVGKTFVRSADRVVEKAKGDEPDNTVTNENGETVVEPNPEGQNGTVFSDGSWRNSMKGLGKAFAGIGKSALNTVSDACDSVTGKGQDGNKPE